MEAPATVDIFLTVGSPGSTVEGVVNSISAEHRSDLHQHWLTRRLGGVENWLVLELGPQDGGYSNVLLQAGAGRIVTIDANSLSYLKSLHIKELRASERLDIRYGDFMAYLESTKLSYDLIVASAVLSHQRDPAVCIGRITSRTNRVFLWTQYYHDDMTGDRFRPDMFTRTGIRRDGLFECEMFRLDYEPGMATSRSRGDVAENPLWMRREDILACLRHHGFTDIDLIFDQIDHSLGPNFALIAQRRPIAGPGKADPETFRAEMQALSGPEAWAIDSSTIHGGVMEVTGWAIPPAGVIGRMAFHVNGQPVVDLDRGLPREDVGSFYWFCPTADRSGFVLRYPVEVASDEPLKLQYVDLATGQVIAPQHDLHIRPQDVREDTMSPQPPLKLIKRSHTGNSVAQFFISGYSIYRTIARHFLEATGQSIEDLGSLLDFGCGPGRLTRYFVGKPGLDVTAADVDRECLDWCRDHLSGATYLLSGLRPPLPLPTGSIDCVLAVNLLFHLKKQDALDWLAEWIRICKPGGTIIVTIGSDLALTRARLNQAFYERIKGQDFVLLSRNLDLDEVISDRSYYQNVLYSHEFVRRVWPTLGVEVLRIAEGCISNHYDLVIMRRL